MPTENNDKLRKIVAIISYIGLATSLVIHIATHLDINLSAGNWLNVVMFLSLPVAFGFLLLLQSKSPKLTEEGKKVLLKRLQKHPIYFLNTFFFFYSGFLLMTGTGSGGEFVEENGEYRLQKNSMIVYETYPDKETYEAAKQVGERGDTKLYSAYWVFGYSIFVLFTVPREEQF